VKSSDDCFKAFESIVADQNQFSLETQTESDTRARLISRILRDALDWPDTHVSREEYANPGFMDYVLSLQRRVLVIEAKKSGDSFQLPSDVSTAETFSLAGILRTVKNLQIYINQVQKYCFDNGIEFACVTNGLQWVIFKAVRTDGIHLSKGRVIVFKSLEDIAERFIQFWNLLGKRNVEENSLVRTFQPSEAPGFQYKRITDELRHYSERVSRNSLSADLEPLIREYMGEIADEKSREKLRDLFVRSKALKEVLQSVEHRISVSLSSTLTTSGRIHETPETERLRNKVKSKIETSFSLPPRGEVILLLGRVGSGKTTFVNHFLRIDLKDTFKNHFLVSLDFRLLEKGQEVRRFFYDTLRTVLSRDNHFTDLSSKFLRKIYSSEIKELTQGPLAALAKQNSKRLEEKISDFLMERYNDTENYFSRCLRYLADKQNVRCILVLDNVDQLEATLQQEIFTFAHSVAGNTHALAMLTMWEETYLRSKTGGALSAYQTIAYTIPPTSVVDIIDRRLAYIQHNLQERNIGPLLLPDPSLINDVRDFLKLLRQSIVHNKRRTRFFLESIAMGNLRKAMEVFSSFLVSGHTDAGKMLSVYRNDRHYDVPLHEFIKSIGLGDRRFYQSNLSSILNLYSISDESRPSHFTKLRLLEYLYFHRTRTSFAYGLGFVPTETIRREFSRIGTSDIDISESLKTLGAAGLVENDIYDFRQVSAAYRVTHAGRYYMRYLSGRFSYLDLVLQDTPICDSATFQLIKGQINSKDMDDRFNRVTAFMLYLNTEEDKEYPVIVTMSESLPLRKRLMAEKIQELEEDKRWIADAVLRRRFKAKGDVTPYSDKA
jgi:KaiC/GvpD/RAD55 family RecA-like ATPase